MIYKKIIIYSYECAFMPLENAKPQRKVPPNKCKWWWDQESSPTAQTTRWVFNIHKIYDISSRGKNSQHFTPQPMVHVPVVILSHRFANRSWGKRENLRWTATKAKRGVFFTTTHWARILQPEYDYILKKQRVSAWHRRRCYCNDATCYKAYSSP